MTNLVKEYKGVKIWISPQGEFYCDIVNNSNEYIKKTLNSTKLSSLEKGIDQYETSEIEGEIYYDIHTYLAKIEPLQVTKKIGSMVFFNDGTSTSHYSRKMLYPAEIDGHDDFNTLVELFEKAKENNEAINKLVQLGNTYRLEATKIVSKFKKVNVK